MRRRIKVNPVYKLVGSTRTTGEGEIARSNRAFLEKVLIKDNVKLNSLQGQVLFN